MRISDWSSDVCSSDLLRDQVQIALTIGGPEIVQQRATLVDEHQQAAARMVVLRVGLEMLGEVADALGEDRHLHLGRTGVALGAAMRSEEHTSELQSLMRISYAVFCLKKQTQQTNTILP